MDFFLTIKRKFQAFFHRNREQIRNVAYISLKVLMLIITCCALFGLSALVFFMCEQALIDFGVMSWGVIYLASAVGAGIVFLAHVATWGKESLRTVDWLLGRTSSESTASTPRTRTQNIIRISLIVLAILGTSVFSVSSYLGFLSMATALGATGLGLLAIQAFGMLCSASMLVSAGLFAVNSMLKEVDSYFEKYNLKKARGPRQEAAPHEEGLQQYRQIKDRNTMWAKIVSAVLAVGNAMGDVIFKSFAFSHWLLLVGLGSISASGAIAFSPVGIILLLIGGISSFSLSLSTEGIRMVSTGKAIAKKFNDRVKVALVPGKTVRAPEEMTMLQRFGQLIGNAVAALVSLMTAIPALTSSISKVAGLGAFILWCLPGMQGVAFGLSLGLGLFFCISKFIGYYSQSGPYIINAVSEKTQSFQSSYTDSMQRLMPEPQVKPEVEVAPEPEQARVEAPEQSGVAAKLDSFYRFMTGTKKAPEGASQQARLAI